MAAVLDERPSVGISRRTCFVLNDDSSAHCTQRDVREVFILEWKDVSEMSQAAAFDSFSSRNFLKTSNRINVFENIPQQSDLQVELEPLTLRLGDVSLLDLIPIHDFQTKSHVVQPELEIIDESSTDKESSNESDFDLWDDNAQIPEHLHHHIKSWAIFEDSSRVRKTDLLSETASSTYDAVVAHISETKSQKPLHYIQHDIFLAALRNVVVGRSSFLFSWQADERCFKVKDNTFTLAGYSHGTTATLCHQVCMFGKTFRKLKSFCGTSKSTDPTVYAIQSAVEQSLQAIEHDWTMMVQQQSSWLGFQETMLQYEDLVSMLSGLTTEKSTEHSVEVQLSQCVEFLEGEWHSDRDRQTLITKIIKDILTPALESTFQMLGLSAMRHIQIREQPWILHMLLPELEKEYKEAEQCHETLTSLGVDVVFTGGCSETTMFDEHWLPSSQYQDLAMCDTSKNSMAAPHQQSRPSPFQPDFIIPVSTGLAGLTTQSVNSIHELTLQYLRTEQDTSNLISISPLTNLRLYLTTIIQQRHVELSRRLLTVLFDRYNLQDQFNTLHQHLLLGDIDFAERLSNALFAYDEGNAEGRRSTGLAAGLRINQRTSWPPSTSELRLVLLRVVPMTDSISFAIRDLSTIEQAKAQQLDSLHALDFLQMSYSVPHPVMELIISSKLLERYNGIFRHLLSILRLHNLSKTAVSSRALHTASMKGSNERRFWLLYHHFVTAWLDYATHTAINQPWLRFKSKMHHLSQSLLSEMTQPMLTTISSLRRDHKATIEEIEISLLLSKSCSKLNESLQDILKTGLIVFKDGMVDSEHIAELIRLITSLLELVRARMSKSPNAALSKLESFLVAFDLSDFYSGALR